MKWAGPAPAMVVEHQEGELDCRGPSEETRGLTPTRGLPSSGFQSREEEFPQNLTVKINGDSGLSE